MATKKKRDGFEVVDSKTGQVAHFVECDYDGGQRGRVERGLMMKTDPERFFVRDTRAAFEKRAKLLTENPRLEKWLIIECDGIEIRVDHDDVPAEESEKLAREIVDLLNGEPQKARA